MEEQNYQSIGSIFDQIIYNPEIGINVLIDEPTSECYLVSKYIMMNLESQNIRY